MNGAWLTDADVYDDAFVETITAARPTLHRVDTEALFKAHPGIRETYRSMGVASPSFMAYRPGWRAPVLLGAPSGGQALLRLTKVATALIAERC